MNRARNRKKRDVGEDRERIRNVMGAVVLEEALVFSGLVEENPEDAVIRQVLRDRVATYEMTGNKEIFNRL